jgi:hypothetical protein
VHEGERGEGNKRKRESCWKSGGGRTRLYSWRRTGLADEVGSDTIPDTAGGEVVMGPLHKYVFNLQLFHSRQPKILPTYLTNQINLPSVTALAKLPD